MRFRYHPTPVQFTDNSPTSTIFRPVISIRVVGPTGAMRLRALIDSGADCTIFPRRVAEKIGVKLPQDQPIRVGGIEGSDVETYPGEVDLELRQRGESVRWRAALLFGGCDNFLLGQIGFFEFFTVSFDHYGRTVEILPNARIVST